MKAQVRKFVLKILSLFNLALVRRDSYLNHFTRSENFFRLTRDGSDLVFFRELLKSRSSGVLETLDLLSESNSQLRQDLLVLWLLDFKRNGVFIEFGATDGIDLSNTFLLENKFNWTGVLAEPATIWHKELRVNRKCTIDTHAISSSTGELIDFLEADNAVYSVIEKFETTQRDVGYRKKYTVTTKTLLDLIEENHLPKIIDYISIDTEGSEFDILEVFNFDKYLFRVITVEHSNQTEKEKIYDLLTSKGYIQIFGNVSNFDDWYIQPNLVNFVLRE
jgi:FkbM family methyltransferase